MNRKGFAVTGVIYSLMILFIILVIALLSMFSDRKTTLDKFKNDVLNEMNGYLEVKTSIFTPTSSINEFSYKVLLDGYYEVDMITSNGIELTSEFYFHKNENLRIHFGNKNTSGNVSLYIGSNTLISLDNTSTKDNYYITTEYDNRLFFNTEFDDTNKHEIKNSSFTIRPKNKQRKSKYLDNVKYIKECIYSDSVDSPEYGWSEFMIIHNGENITGKVELDEAKSDILSTEAVNLYDYNFSNTVLSTKTEEEESCVVYKLNSTNSLNLDYIKIWHNFDDRIYFGRKLSVSSNGINYEEIDNVEQKESIDGNTVSAFDDKKTIEIDGKYFPIKSFDGATWLRIFHHNSKDGNVYWASRSQLLDDIYDSTYKKSLLSHLDEFKTNNKYEFLLEYPDIDANKYNRWVQKNSIIDKNELSVKEYSQIHIDFSSDNHPFSGLKYSNGNYTVINGDDDNNYAIGYLKSDLIPGFDNYINGRVDLWIRIDEYLKIS